MVLRQAYRHALQVGRSFSTSSARPRTYVSNIGKQLIQYPPGVTLTPNLSELSVQGPLGTTCVALHPFVRLTFNDPNTLVVGVEDPSERKQRAMWGTTRTLIHNAIIGMTEGFSVPLYLVGVGYRAALEDDPRGKTEGMSGKRLNLKLGFSHSVHVLVPEHITVDVQLPTKIILSCTDKQLLGLFAAKVRKWRPPEPYKGKGVFVGNERVRLKTVRKK